AKGVVPSFYSRAASSQSFILTCSDGARVGVHLSSPVKFWTSLVDAIGEPSLLSKYPTKDSRVAGYDELSKDLAAIFALRPRDEWLSLLEKHDVPAAPELRLDNLKDDPQVSHLGTFYEMIHPVHGKVVAANRAIRYDGDNRSGFRPPPAFGEHSDDVLQEAGLPPEEIAELRAARVVV
ncbi:MAG TPA: CoA transferase, partial [Ramlibacter sp.]|nr:CoA transferase [Ramlibacter sp.]